MAFRYTGTSTRVINFGSYNYLGFSENKGPCAQAVEKSVNELGNAICASRQELGTVPLFVFDIHIAIIIIGGIDRTSILKINAFNEHKEEKLIRWWKENENENLIKLPLDHSSITSSRSPLLPMSIFGSCICMMQNSYAAKKVKLMWSFEMILIFPVGYLQIHKELDDLVADYLGVEAAITVPMGFATNSMNLPALVEKVLVNCTLLIAHRSHVFMIYISSIH